MKLPLPDHFVADEQEFKAIRPELREQLRQVETVLRHLPVEEFTEQTFPDQPENVRRELQERFAALTQHIAAQLVRTHLSLFTTLSSMFDRYEAFQNEHAAEHPTLKHKM